MQDIPRPQALGDGRTWTAEYVSFDPRHGDVYFGMTIRDPGKAERRFMVVVLEYLGDWDGEKWTRDPAGEEPHYRRELHAAALRGESNCEHGTLRYPGA